MSDAVQYRLKAKDQPGPNCMWTVDRPDLGMVGSGYRFQVLSENIQRWRRANGIPIGLDFESELENVLCAQHPETCFTDDPRAPITVDRIRLVDVIQGTRVMISHLRNTRQLVSRDEAEQRASKCANCRLNVNFPKGCSGGICGELKDIVTAIVGGNGTSYDSQLHSCFICKCFLQASVWVPADIQVAALTEHQKIQYSQVKDYCWKAQAIDKGVEAVP